MSRLGTALLVLLAVPVAGCVSVPTSGPVREVEQEVTVEPAPVNVPVRPVEGASPSQIVLGFLDAMEAYPISTDVAIEYLTEEAAQRWRPGRRTVVYDSRSTVEQAPDTVQLDVNEVVELNGRGTYRPAPGRGQRLRTDFSLTQVDGQWRISDPPDGLYVSFAFFDRYYEPFDLFFLDPSQQALVADPVFLPIGDQLTTQLVRGVLAGPTRWLGTQASTPVPSSAQVQVSVPLGSDGVADVQLSAAIADLSVEQLRLLAGQLAWTLRQVPGVDALRISIDGTPVDVGAGGGEVQPVDAFSDLDPSGDSTRSQLYALTKTGALTVVGDEEAYPGYWGGANRALADFSIDRALTRVAATPRDRTEVLVGPLAADAGSQVNKWYATSGRVTDPQWDRTGQLWLLDHVDGSRTAPASWVVVDDGVPRTIQVGPLEAATVRGMTISADGARVAALVDEWDGPVWGGGEVRGPAVVVARVTRGADGRTVRRLDGAYAVPTAGVELGALLDVAWGAPSHVSVLADLPLVPTQPYQLAVDGSELVGGDAPPGSVGARTLATAGVSGAVTVVGTRDGRLLVIGGDDRWVAIAEGLRRPRYGA